MLNGYDPKTSLQHHPLPMARFGLNPFGETMYRIVLIESRRSIVYGQWNGSGHPRASWQPTYPHLMIAAQQMNDPQETPALYVLEKWLSAFEFAGCSAAAWARDLDCLMLGNYPHRGEYQMIGSTAIRPADTNIDKLIMLVEAGSKFSWAEKLAACRLNSAKAEADKATQIHDIIEDCLPYKGTEALVGGGTSPGRGTKTAPILKSANELHLPRPTTQNSGNGGSRMMSPQQARRFGFGHAKVELVGA